MTVWALLLVTSSGTSVPLMVSYSRVAAHYSNADACNTDLKTVLPDVKSGKLGAAVCVSVSVPATK